MPETKSKSQARRQAVQKVARDAESGEFVTAEEAKADPAGTVVETVAKLRARKPRAVPVISEEEAKFRRVYRDALLQGVNPEYPYGGDGKEGIREDVQAEFAKEQDAAEAEAQRVAKSNRDANAEALAKKREAK